MPLTTQNMFLFSNVCLQLEDEKNIYDVVEEGAYSDMVRQRQEDDWIVDDGKFILYFPFGSM